LRDETSIAFKADCKGNKNLLHAVTLVAGKTPQALPQQLFSS
jgi:hypothetical protein